MQIIEREINHVKQGQEKKLVKITLTKENYIMILVFRQ